MRYLFILFLIAGCASTQQINMPTGEVYSSQISDGTMIKLTTPSGHIIEIDRRGRPSAFEDILKLYGLKLVDDAGE